MESSNRGAWALIVFMLLALMGLLTLTAIAIGSGRQGEGGEAAPATAPAAAVPAAPAAPAASPAASPTATPAATPEPPRAVTAAQTLPPPPNAQLVAGNFENPRGFAWGPDGSLYVAEASSSRATGLPGTSGPNDPSRVQVLFCEGWRQTSAPPPPNCPQNNPPQYLYTGRVTRIAPNGSRSVVADQLPVVAGMFGFAEGPASVAVIGTSVYVVIIHTTDTNVPDGFNTGVYRIESNGSGTLIAAIDDYVIANPPRERPPDYDVSEPHDMVALNGKLYVSDGNAGVVYEIDPALPRGQNIRYIADLSADFGGVQGSGHPVLTGLAAGPDGNIYVTNLSRAPYPPGASSVWRINVQNGQITQVVTGLSLGVGLALAPDGTIYAAEFAKVLSTAPFIEPGGRIVRAAAPNTVTPVLDPLFYPTIIRWGPDNQLYVTYFSIGAENGQSPGAIYRFRP
jgi:hypothetical protein